MEEGKKRNVFRSATSNWNIKDDKAKVRGGKERSPKNKLDGNLIFFFLNSEKKKNWKINHLFYEIQSTKGKRWVVRMIEWRYAKNKRCGVCELNDNAWCCELRRHMASRMFARATRTALYRSALTRHLLQRLLNVATQCDYKM